jgi:hypothetical protein
MTPQVEPWLRGTLTDVDPIRRQVLHALQLAAEDADLWCAPLTPAQLEARPHGLAPVAFHLRHIAGSLDRLLTYADARLLTDAQLAFLGKELTPSPNPLETFQQSITEATARILRLDPTTYTEPRTVGRHHLPTTVAGLLIHCAEHTQRHIGQAITTAQIITKTNP